MKVIENNCKKYDLMNDTILNFFLVLGLALTDCMTSWMVLRHTVCRHFGCFLGGESHAYIGNLC